MTTAPPCAPTVRTPDDFEAHCRALAWIPRWALRLQLVLDFHAAGVDCPPFLHKV